MSTALQHDLILAGRRKPGGGSPIETRYPYTGEVELEFGGVIVNDVNIWRVDHMPYGGVKGSGFGREGLRYAIREQTEPKLLVLNLSQPLGR